MLFSLCLLMNKMMKSHTLHNLSGREGIYAESLGTYLTPYSSTPGVLEWAPPLRIKLSILRFCILLHRFIFSSLSSSTHYTNRGLALVSSPLPFMWTWGSRESSHSHFWLQIKDGWSEVVFWCVLSALQGCPYPVPCQQNSIWAQAHQDCKEWVSIGSSYSSHF